MACGLAQPSLETAGKLKQQKENIITSGTVIQIENLGYNVNSELEELRPTISADGNLLFFICQNHPDNTKYNSVPNSQDIWVSEKDSATGKWGAAVHLPAPLNVMQYNAVYWISPDNNRLLIRGAFDHGDRADELVHRLELGVPAIGGLAAAAAIGNPVTMFQFPPIDLQISTGGRWVYVLERDAAAPNHGYLQPVDTHAVELNTPPMVGNAVPVGLDPVSLAISQDGSQLYVPYAGDEDMIPGGVAVVNVLKEDCCGLFDQAIEGCPDCEDGNCIVLATISKYTYGKPVNESDIDNLTDRHLLPSVDLLAEVVRCLCDREPGTGGTGSQGPPGSPGCRAWCPA